MTYPISFRRDVLAIKEREGLTFLQVAERFSVGIASLICWSAKLEPKEYWRERGLKVDLEKLAQDVGDDPDAYQYEHAARFGVTPKAIWQALHKLGVTYKRPLHNRAAKPKHFARWQHRAAPACPPPAGAFTISIY